MLPGLALVIPNFDSVPVLQTYLEMTTAAGLASNLQLLLDAADVAGWNGDGTWHDTSGNGNDFAPVTGTGGGNPVFHGVQGALTEDEFFTQDGSGYAFAETTAQVFAQAYHKNNARFSFFSTFHVAEFDPDEDFEVKLFDSGGSGSAMRGVSVLIYPYPDTLDVQLLVGKGSTGYVLNVAKSFPRTLGWQTVGVAVNEASSAGGLMYVNGNRQTFNPTYSSPSSTDEDTLPNSLFSASTLMKLQGLWSWSVERSGDDFDALHAAIRSGRLSGLPAIP